MLLFLRHVSSIGVIYTGVKASRGYNGLTADSPARRKALVSAPAAVPLETPDETLAMVDPATLQRLLEIVERGMFTPSLPGDLRDAWEAALSKGFVAQFDDDDCALTDAGRAYLARSREGPDYWAWPFKPCQDGCTTQCRDAKARSPLTPRRNLEKYRLGLAWRTALPNQGEDFGVTIHDANPTQDGVGVGRQYYVPTPEDLAIVQELFPAANRGNPPWNQIETSLVLAGHNKNDLRQHNAATLIRLLQNLPNASVEPAVSPKAAPRAPVKNKAPKKSRRRKSRVAELLFILLSQDRTNANLNCTELAAILECSISAVSRAFSHNEYGPKITKIYRDYGIRPPGIRQI